MNDGGVTACASRFRRPGTCMRYALTCTCRQKKRQKYRSFDEDDVWEMESNRRFKSVADRHARLGRFTDDDDAVRTAHLKMRSLSGNVPYLPL